MDVDFFAQCDDANWLVWPALCLTQGECECCGERGGLMISLGWLCFSVGVVFPPTPHGP